MMQSRSNGGEPLPIKQIYLERSLSEGVVAQNVLSRAGTGVRVELVEDPAEILQEYLKKGRFLEKDTLLIHRYQGSFLSTCPGSDGMVCCNYFVINLGLNCIYDCHYCFLQSFLNQPLMTVFGNFEDLFSELESRVRGKALHYRIGTGEYSDSLALDPLTGISPLLVNYFATLPNATLELKTKSDAVEELLTLDHQGHTVVSWSINPQRVIDEVEEGTVSLQRRIEAALKVQEAGYKLAFHFDPVIYYEGWERDYHGTLDQLFSRIDPDRVAWISMGGFRYSPGLKEVIQERFPEDHLTEQEMVQGSDGKYRYFKTIREEVYTSIKKKIESMDPALFLYMCMETRPMWQKIYGFTPDSARKLDQKFEERRIRIDSGRR